MISPFHVLKHKFYILIHKKDVINDTLYEYTNILLS